MTALAITSNLRARRAAAPAIALDSAVRAG